MLCKTLKIEYNSVVQRRPDNVDDALQWSKRRETKQQELVK